MAIIFDSPSKPPKGKSNKPDGPKGPRIFTPPPVGIGPRNETLDRRIRNIEALDQGVFTGNLLASYLALPGLVGFWPMSSVQRSTGNVYDLSGQDRTLTYNGNPAFTYHNGLIPYIDLDGTGDYLSRADETDLDILGNESIFTTAAAGLTMGCWFNPTNLATSFQSLMTKGLNTGAGDSYRLFNNSGVLLGQIFNGGTAYAASTTIPAATTWYFAALRFVPSTSVDVWLNGTKASNTTSIPATITNSTAAFQIGALNGGSFYIGKMCLCFLCANNLGDDLISSLYRQGRIFFGS